MAGETKLEILDAIEKSKENIHLRKLNEIVKGSFPNIRRFVLLMEKQGIIRIEHQGNLWNLSINNSILSIAYLKMVHTSRLLEMSEQIRSGIAELNNRISLKPLISMIYGYDKKNKKNAINLVLIFQKVEDESGMLSFIESVEKKYGIKINPLILDYNSFVKKFVDKYDDFSHEIREDNAIMFGVEHYYDLYWRYLR